MSLLINCQSIAKAFGSAPVFSGISVTISEQDRLGLIGPNGAGKSTLLKILAGLEPPDSGEVSLRKGTRLRYVPQDSVYEDDRTVRQVLEAAVTAGEDEREAKIATTLGIAGFRDDAQLARSLSGGWRKRLAIAEALIAEPNILLADEPTNHLDLEGILWLESILVNSRFAVVIVSHDRYFLEKVATSMAELSRQYPDGLFRTPGNYSRFLEKRADFFAAQSKLEDSLATRVRREVEWLQRGAKARTTKAKARIDEANRLIGELDDVSTRNRSVSGPRIDFVASERRTKRLIDCEKLAAERGGRRLFTGLDLTLSPGMRLGLAGANGSGKSTLLKILKGDLEPAEGSLRRADALQVVYFDQHREQLDPAMPLKRALAEHGDSVIYRDRVQHVAGWAKRFLFRAEQLEVPVGALSGGERARVQIARLMLEPADVLLLDEPTNDLDIPTLEVLEDSLLEFPGALVLVTHDRYLLDRVATSVLAIDADGGIQQYAEYAQWEQSLSERKSPRAERAPAPKREDKPAAKKKLSYLEAREFEGMEESILAAESSLEERKAAMHDPAITADPQRLDAAYRAMLEAQDQVESLYARWAELEAKATA